MLCSTLLVCQRCDNTFTTARDARRKPEFGPPNTNWKQFDGRIETMVEILADLTFEGLDDSSQGPGRSASKAQRPAGPATIGAAA